MKSERIAGWRLYVITDSDISGKSHQDAAKAAMAGGADVIQFREKNCSSAELYEIAGELREITRKADVDFIVNDRLDIAQAVDADGVHLGQDDIPISVAREILGPDKIIGGSARYQGEAEQMAQEGVDYLGLGPVYEARSTKHDTVAPQGLDLVRKVKQETTLPIVAIGGIGPENLSFIFEAGADSVAVISAIMKADDITKATRDIKETIENLQPEGNLV
ncbi:MAG: thiamine phosphate synthase [Candidatus Marinimicrobia bacterium]|nr:thiamine phosphate synthase [Candidatus Neomarinimicrobiota bacterium]MCF7828887.1 thiamine phosphate synthase [Candidatus Neomarinimicrobiota bacterium]MCF7879847.1 thiamine phosphate synthase [Candidatus Neomarinimicrobiota bacterium]